MRETLNRYFGVVTMVVLVALAVVAVAPSYAAVVPQSDALREMEFRHADLWYENVFRAPAELPAGVAQQLGAELSRLGVDPGHAFFDLRTGRWGTLILVEPMIPGSGKGNNLQWSDLRQAAAPNGEALKQVVWDEFRTYLATNAADLRVDPQELADQIVTVIGDRLVYIHAGRQIDGIPVRDTFVKAALNSGNLVLVGERNWGPVDVSTSPQLSAADAENIVREYIANFPFTSLRSEPRLELIPTSSQPEEAASLLGAGLEHRLAWVLTPDIEGHIGNWEALVDAHSGELLSLADTNHYASRRVEGWVYPVANDGVPPDGVMQPGFPMPFADIALDGTDVGFATTGGNSPAGSDAGAMSTELSGRYIRMSDQCGAMNESVAGGDLDLEGLDFPATDCEVPAGHSPGDTQASRTGFYELNRLAELARGYLPDNVWLDQQLTAVMNIPQVCNANWNGSTVNFFSSAIPQGCRNTGEIAGVFDHEWGHGMDDNDGNGFVSNPGEGIADIFAHNRLNTSCIGRGFFVSSQCNGYGDPCLDCTGIRDIDWEKRVSQQPHDIDWINANCGGGPAPCGGIVHCEGAVYSEAEYDLVHRDLQGFEGSPFNLDPHTALEIGTRLTFYGSSNVGNWYQCTNDGTGGCNADGGYLGYLTADDDNGDLTDGTPHMSAIFAAFDRHQISCNAPAVVDSGCAGGPSDAPANVVATTFDEGVELSWDAVAGAEEYWIFRTEGVHGCDFGKALVGKTTDTTFSEQGLRNGFEVFYSVSAAGASDACVSPMSECLSVIPTAGPSGFIEGTVTDAVTGDPIEDAAVEAVGPVTVSDATDDTGFYRILAPIGTYDVTADAEDYDPETQTGIEVTEGGTVTADFALTLTPVPVADISPDSFSFAVQQGDTGSDTLNMGNIGVLDLVWSVAEDDAPTLAPQPLMQEEWSDNFDSYETGSEIHGQGGWKGWLNDPAAGALVSDAQAQSTPNSVEIVGASDLVHEYVDSNSGQWTYTAWQFLPADFTGTSMFIMLNTYDDGGSGLNWSTQVEFRAAEEAVVNAGTSGGTLPLIRGQWVEIRVEIDLVADTQDFFYNGELLYSGTWTQEVSGGGALNIGAVDLFANAASPVYYDDLALTDVTVAPPCTEPSDVPWLSVSPESGTTPPAGTVPVDVSVDTTGLDEGDLSALLCVTTNDPNAELVQIPVSLTVLPSGGPIADVTPDSFTFTVEQGGSDDDILNLGNLGGQELTWNIDESESPLLPVIMPEGAPYRYGLAEMPAFNAPVGGDRASGTTRARGEAPADRVVLPAPQVQALGDFTEGFDDIQQLPGAGWAMVNNSDPEGPSSWFQGNESIFPAHEGAPNAYIAANYESTADNGTISNWLITPEVQIVNGTEACFWTRKSDLFGEFLDRLEVRMSDEGESTDVGETADSVGDFTTLLLTIEPDLELPNEYPEEWTEFCVTVRERSREPVTGRFAFRYWVTDSGPDGTNGDYIGIDTVSVTQPGDGPPPGGDCDNPVDIPWLSVDPNTGATPPLSSVPASVVATSGDLDLGEYTAQLCVNTNDPENPQIVVPVTLNVVEDDGVPELLLVDDDDNGPDVREFITATLDGLGQTYNIWDTENSDNEPTPADLEPYDAVIWFTGDSFGGFAGPGPDGEASLGTWLDDGGCLFMSSQDYLYDRDLTPFIQNYLGVLEFTSDQGQIEVTGAGSVFGGLGPYALSYPISNFSDIISPDTTAELAFTGNAGDAAVNKDSGTYKTAFWGFPFVALPDAAAREESMLTVLDWCGVTEPTGFIDGTVTDLTNGGTPVEGADVTAGARTVQTDVDGNYSMRVPVGTYDVTATKDNYVPVTVPGVEVVVDATTTVDFELEGSTLSYTPASIEESMESGDVVSTTVTLNATGPLPVDFEVSIGGFDGPTASPPFEVRVVEGARAAAPHPAVDRSTLTSAGSASNAAPAISKAGADRRRDDGAPGAATDLASVLGGPLPSVPVVAALGGVDCDTEPGIIIHDDGTVENGYSGNPATVNEVRFVDKFTPADYPATFSNVCVAFVTTGGATLDFDIVVYDDDGADGAPGTELGALAVSADGIPTFPNPTPVWFSYDISSLGVSIDDGDAYLGVRYSPPSAPTVYSAADESTGNPPGFAGGYWWNNNDGAWAQIQTAFPLYRSMFIRPVSGAAGAIWASADPSSGTVDPGTPFTLEVIFDATELVQEGTYTANLDFSGSFVNDPPEMPLTMHLTCPTCGTLDGAISDSVTGDPVSATVTVLGDGGFTASSEGETYSLTAPADTYTITAEADGYFPQTVEGVVLGAGETVTTDFALVFQFADLQYTPASIEETMESGDTVTNTVTVTNSGTIDLEFNVSIGGYESPGLHSDPSPHLIPPSEAQFSAAAPVGPLSVRSAEGREAFAEPLPSLLWETGAPMPTGLIRYAHTQCADQPESFYTISGVGPGFAIVPDNQRYDADTDTWTTLAPIPVPQEGVSGVCFEGNIYVVGGGGTTQFFIYDIAADSWSAGPALPRGVWGAAMGAIDGKVFMIGGDNDFAFGGTSNEVNIYDIAAGTWSSGASMPVAAVTAGSVQADNYVYVVGGWGDASPASNVDVTQRYDMSTDTWETGPTFTSARADFALAVSADNLYAIAGDNNAGGPFDASALVESLAHGSWPGGEWADISDPLPQAVTAINGGFCTSGKVWAPGGTPGPGTSVSDANRFRETGEGCFSGGVQWASADPSSGTVPPGGSTTFDVTFDATELVQAGTYTANLNFSGNFNNDVPTMPLTMNLTCPTCGTLDGAITDSVSGDPVEASVTILGDGGFTATQTGDTYSMTAPADTYTITVEADGYFPQTAEDVILGVGETVTTDFALVFQFADLQYTPASIEETMVSGDIVTNTVTVSNNGTIDLEYNVSIGGYEYPELRSDPSPHLIAPSEAQFSDAAPVGPLSVRSAEGREAFAEPLPSLLWETGAPMPTGLIRYAHTQCADQPESFYTISGVGPGFAIVPDNQRYDADTDTWTTLAPIPVPQEGVSGVCFEGNIYVVGGGGTTQFFIYDIAADSWSAGPALPRGVWGAAMGALDGKVFMIGGDNDFAFGGTSNEVNIYDIAAGTWSSGAPMPTAAVTAGSVQAGNYVYVVGGWGDASPASNVDVTQRYDMSTDTWETGPTFTSARADFALAVSADNLYAIAGDNNAGGPFDASALVESLAHGSWPGGEWADISDPLPQAVTAINGGFCTSGKVWAPGGTPGPGTSVSDANRFRETGEGCFSGGVLWASADPSSGTVPPGGSTTFDVTFDATEIVLPGIYTAELRFSGNFNNDPADMPLTMNVTE